MEPEREPEERDSLRPWRDRLVVFGHEEDSLGLDVVGLPQRGSGTGRWN